MLKRRKLIKSSALLLGGLAGKNLLAASSLTATSELLYLPDEGHRHKRTWMAFVANDYVWSSRQIPEVKKDLILIAKTIAKYEPVSMLVGRKDYDEAISLIGNSRTLYPIELIKWELDDLWLRDTGPTFVMREDGRKVAIDFNFNGWGNKQEHMLDSEVAGFIGKRAGAELKKSGLVLEGGCFETDGQGTAILSRSCILNDNRNPGMSQRVVEKEFKRILGFRKIIWLNGVEGMDITDGHTDFYVRFVEPGKVIVSRDNYTESFDYEITRENIEILKNSTDANGNKLNLIILDTPEIINEDLGTQDFAAGYVGYYVCNGAVIAQKFGDPWADDNAKKILRKAFPERTVEQLAIDGIASGGGSIHCTTQQEI